MKRKYRVFKEVSISLLLLISVFVFLGCSSTEHDEEVYYEDPTVELEEQIKALEEENSNLKNKLDSIYDKAYYRDYNYNDILDDIEEESLY